MSVRNIGKPQVAFLFAVLLFMSIRIGLIVLRMNNEVDLKHWQGRISEKGLGGWAPQKYLQAMSSD